MGRAGVGLGVAGEPAHPVQPRVGRPGRQAVVGAQALRLVGRGDGRRGRARTCPTSSPTSARTTCRPTERDGAGRDRRRHAVHHAGRRPGLAVRTRRASSTARCPRTTSRTSRRSTTRSTRSSANPARQRFDRPGQPLATRTAATADAFPFVLTTYRLTEHHTAGGMSRFLPYLSELQPEMFCEVSPELAAERRPRARRLGDDHQPRGPRSRRGCWSPTARAAAPGRARRAPGRAAVPLGHERPVARRRGQRPVRDRARPQRAHPGVEGRHLRHPARADGTSGDRARAVMPRPGRRATATRRRSASASSPTPASASAARRARSPARSGTSVPEDGLRLHRRLLRQHRRAGRQQLAACRLRRAGRTSDGDGRCAG